MSNFFSIFSAKKIETRVVAWWTDPAPQVEQTLAQSGQFNVQVVHDPANGGQVVDDMATAKTMARCYIIGQPSDVVDAIAALSTRGFKGLHQVIPLDEDRFWSRIVCRKNMLLPPAANQ